MRAGIFFSFLFSFLFLFLSERPDVAEADATAYDVIVAGGGISGMAAALQAAKLGAGVLVAEPGDWIGGQATAAGVSTMDDLSPLRSGLYRHFIARIKRHYDRLGKSMATCYWNAKNIAFEPSTGQRVLFEMADEIRAASPGPLDILLRTKVTRVERQGNRITGVTITDRNGTEREIRCRVLIDATEYGDILPLAGAGYRAGNSATPSIDPKAVIQDITWITIIQRYPRGIPGSLRVTTPLPGYPEARKIYERYVTAKGGTFQGTYPVRLPVDFVTHNAYRGLPDSSTPQNYDGQRKNWKFITKTSVNWGNDYPGHVIKTIPGLPVAYLEDEKIRAQMEKEAFLRTLHFIYYIQNELGEPWSVANDEYNAAALPPAAGELPEEWREIARRMPPIPYVRESRRVIGDHTLTSEELFYNSQNYLDGQSHEFEDAIAIGRYGLDLHGANEDAHMERNLNERTASIELNRPRNPFQVPLRILIPKNVEGLLAAEKNLSMTRLVSGALRVQPICMMVGQAAGALAALSLRDGLPLREVPPVRVQRTLLEAGVVLSLSNYSDVSSKHPFFRAIQLSSLHRLLRPIVPPRLNPSAKGIFGVNRPVARGEMFDILKRARAASGTFAEREPDETKNIEGKAKAVTRQEFLEAVFRAFEWGDFPSKSERTTKARSADILQNLGVPGLFGTNMESALARPVTRGEAAEILMKAMTMKNS
jgi:hypothetical protein